MSITDFCLRLPTRCYSKSQTSYIMLSSPYTCPQFRMAWSIFWWPQTLLDTGLSKVPYRWEIRFSDGSASGTFLTSVENLKMGQMASQFCFQLFIKLGYVTDHVIRYNKFRKNKKRHGLQNSGRMKSRHTILKGASKPCLKRLYSLTRK